MFGAFAIETEFPPVHLFIDQPARPMPPDQPTVRGPSRYCRATDLPKLVAMWPHQINDMPTSGHARLIAKLKRALREERLRGLSGHWTYDLARHSPLLAAYKCEVAAFDANLANGKKGPAHAPAPPNTTA